MSPARMDGLTVAERLRTAPRITVLASFDAAAQVMRALVAGASGFLLKGTPSPPIVDAIGRFPQANPLCRRRHQPTSDWRVQVASASAPA